MSIRIDAHHHFWKYNPKEYEWISENMNLLKRDFLPEMLKQEISKVKVDGVISIQARQTLEETDWLLKHAGEYDFIKGVVGWFNLRDKNVTKQIEKFSQNKKLVGVRHVIQDEPDDEFILRKDFQRGIKILNEFNLTFDILVYQKHLPHVLKFLKMFSEQPFVIDHIAKPDIKNGKIEPWRTNIKKLSNFENVFCKVSGMVTETDWHNWEQKDFNPYLDVILETFGASRIMLGSDWPVCTLAATYEQVLKIPIEYISQLSSDERDSIMGTNALKFYNIKK